jgi:hypothetical protein
MDCTDCKEYKKCDVRESINNYGCTSLNPIDYKMEYSRLILLEEKVKELLGESKNRNRREHFETGCGDCHYQYIKELETLIK